MPNSLTRFLSVTLGFSPHLPVSVYGTDTSEICLEVFLDSMITTSLRANALLITSRGMKLRIYLELPPTCLNRHFQSPAGLHFYVTPSLKHFIGGTGIFCLFAIAYAFRPRLRARLTLGGLTFPRKPWASGVPVSYRHNRYSCQHIHFQNLQ